MRGAAARQAKTATAQPPGCCLFFNLLDPEPGLRGVVPSPEDAQ